MFHVSRTTFLTICRGPAAIPGVGKSSRLSGAWRSASVERNESLWSCFQLVDCVG